MLISKLTPLIQTETGQYPVYAFQIKTPEYSFGDFVDTDVLVKLGYFPVTPTVRPETGDYREVAPTLVDGTYYQTFVEHVPTAEDVENEFLYKKGSLQSTLTELVDQALSEGFAHDFGGAYGVQHVQIRDKDRVNLLGIIKRAEMSPESSHIFRTQENNTLTLTTAEIVGMAVRAGDAYTAVMQEFWSLKDQISAASNVAALPTLPTTLWGNVSI